MPATAQANPTPTFLFNPMMGNTLWVKSLTRVVSLPFIPAPSLPTMFENAAVCEKSSASPASPSMAAAGGGRRRKSSSASSGQPLDPRERNRIAAHKCRRKQKDNVARLQQKERELAQQHDLLATHVGQLREEILLLKNEILAHANCDCDSIQNYISQAARKLM
ncbi:hypothetical protein F4780DRAFT_783449 [Xylariomycetidae sp. FL0641]|nr:hypothetical protein F4780DRAFT_783449 [Xylariomycetidae sp. FL0641]